MRVLLLLVVCSLLTGGSAAAASFDCKKASTRAEKLICATPALSKADDELGRQYKAARAASKDTKALRQAQMGWIRRHRDACADAACMRKVYQQRIAELRATARPGGRTGTYSDAGESSLEILEIAPGVLRFELLGLWSHGDEVNTGQLCGEITIKGSKGTYGRKEDDCQLAWTFGKGGGLTISQQGLCDFGVNVTAEGTYERERSDAPALTLCYE
jgi:uncharacterized protein